MFPFFGNLGVGSWLEGATDLHELAHAEWGQWSKSYGTPEENLDLLLDSHIRRLRWNRQEQAIAVINAYAEAMNGGKKDTGGKKGKGDSTQISGSDMLKILGVKVK